MIELKEIAWAAGEFSLAGIDLSVPGGKYSVLMGKTGCGKTTILELICGLRHPQGGRIVLGDRDVTFLPPGDRGVGYVPQDGAMFPAMTVREQLGFALKIRRRPAHEIAETVARLADELGIEHLLDRKPDGLSGGERGRVALGRALAAKPKVMLLDEPLAALDEDTRDEMSALLKRAQTEHSLTVLHITHNSREADALADRVFRLEAGKIVV
jgi:molybdate/tungstate transport system ATP-binding protein